MNFGFLFAQQQPIPLHAVAAFAAIGLGGVQLAAPKGTLPHRVLGYAWAVLMMVVAGSSLWIHQLRIIGPWSPIHILSLITLVVVPLTVWAGHRHRVGQHRRGMILLYALALVVTGLFTLLPGRVMHTVLFGG